jgi:phage terminase small subunit
MTPPTKLSGAALSYWRTHAPALEAASILTERDAHSFALLCRIWGILEELDTTPGPDNYRAMIQFANLTKQYQSMAKQFGLLPRERKASNMEMNPDTVDEFGI